MIDKHIKYFIIILFSSCLYAQVENLTQFESKSTATFFYYNALNFLDDDSSSTRLDLYIHVPYSQLTFVKTDRFFTASYEINASAYNQENQLVAERIWREKITLNTYEESVAKNSYNLSLRSFKLPYDKYKFRISVEDLESKKIASTEIQITIRDFKKYNFALSDIILVSKYTVENGNKKIIPNITNNIVKSDSGFYLFFEFYKSMSDSLFQIKCNIKNKKDETVLDFTTPFTFNNNRNQIFLHVNRNDFPIGEYTLTLTATTQAEQNLKNYSVKKRLISRWIGIPLSITDLKKAIEQMAYITTREEVERLISIKDNQEMLNQFLEFWKRKDPNPQTDENEVMDEYYRRVEYANKNFKNFQEGWKSDMGMVFIILGPPSNVDRHPFNFDSPAYEIWEYYNLNRRFTFVDYTGFGDYRLINRDYTEWFRFR